MRGTLTTKLLIAFFLATFLLSPMVFQELSWVQPAYADDDDSDDDSDDDDDDDDDDDSSSPGATPSKNTIPRQSGSKTTKRTQTRNAAPAPAPAPLPEFVPGEIVAVGLTDESLKNLEALGYKVIETLVIPFLTSRSLRLSIPDGTAIEAAKDEVQAMQTEALVDFNHYYRLQQDTVQCDGPHCDQFSLLALDGGPETSATCGVGARIGIIDTGINPDHETFTNSRLEVISQAPTGKEPSSAQHGTAVAALLVGSQTSRSPGILPQADVIAIDAFHLEGSDERSDVFALLQAIATLSAKDVHVINMSFAGPPNVLLERAIMRLRENEVAVVAAAGNGGPAAAPAFPAAYDGVIAVTAVDRYSQVYRRAGRGAHVDFAAPGVNVWTAASVRGARAKTGTSFAAPFVSAAVSLVLMQDAEITPEALKQTLIDNALDLGEAGHDEVFGYGLVQLNALCSNGNHQ